MKIKIEKHNEEVTIVMDNSEKEPLTFDVLKMIGKCVLEEKKVGNQFEYEIDSTPDTELYKNTIETVIKSIDEDEDLLNLFKEKDENNQHEAEEAQNSSEV